MFLETIFFCWKVLHFVSTMAALTGMSLLRLASRSSRVLVNSRAAFSSTPGWCTKDKSPPPKLVRLQLLKPVDVTYFDLGFIHLASGQSLIFTLYLSNFQKKSKIYKLYFAFLFDTLMTFVPLKSNSALLSIDCHNFSKGYWGQFKKACMLRYYSIYSQFSRRETVKGVLDQSCDSGSH